MLRPAFALAPLLFALSALFPLASAAQAKTKPASSASTGSTSKKPTSKAPPKKPQSGKKRPVNLGNYPPSVATSRYRGWDYIVSRLRQRGVAEGDIAEIYQNPRLPRFTYIPFSLAPREKSAMYRNFSKPIYAVRGATFVRENPDVFGPIQESLKVPPEVVAAILVIESGIGKNTGKEMIVYRLSRLASTCDPDNLKHNLIIQRRKDPSVTMDDVKARCAYLEETFLPEIPALIEIGKRNQVPVLKVQGSSAGAFGLPQFLPTAFLRFGMDGDKNGIVSLYHPADAAWSAANYLSSYGYRDDIPEAEKRAVIWRYNKSDAYIDAVLTLSRNIRRELDTTPPIAATDTQAPPQS